MQQPPFFPDIITHENSSLVIVAVLWFFGIIQSTIQLHYPQVQRIIKLASLIENSCSG